MVWNKFPWRFSLSLNSSEQNSECFSFLWNGSERNSEHFYLPRNGLEWNYEVPSVFLLYKIVWNGITSAFTFSGMVPKETKFRMIFSSTKWFRQTSKLFIFSGLAWTWIPSVVAFFVPRNRRNLDGMNKNFRLFRVPQNIFFSLKMATLV